MYYVNELPPKKMYEFVSLDLEMYGQDKERLHIAHGTFACLSITLPNRETYIIDDLAMVSSALDAVEMARYWVFANATYDLRQLRAFVPIEPRPVWDIMVIEQILWGGYFVEFGLKAMARRYFNVVLAKDKYEELHEGTISREELYQYVAEDSTMTMDIRAKQLEYLENDPQTLRVYQTIEQDMPWVVLDTLPVHVDAEAWLNSVRTFKSRSDSLEAELGVNVMSSPKLKEYLKQYCKITVEDCREETLSEYAYHPTVAKILETKMYRHAVSYNGEKWVKDNVNELGFVQGNWKIVGAETGRMSCSKPNLMNIPVRKMPIFRTFFIPRDGHVFIVADLSQQEPRITAILSEDDELIRVFNEHEDIHSFVANQMFNTTEITKGDPRRKIGKETGLGIVYGLTKTGLRLKLVDVLNEGREEHDHVDVTEEEAQEFIDKYFKKFPKVKNFIRTVQQRAFKDEYVRTFFGRKAWLNIHNPQWEKNAINDPVQGGAGDLMKMWIVLFWRTCRALHIPYPAVLYIHDEIVLDVNPLQVEQYVNILGAALHQAQEVIFANSPVDFEFEYAVGENWGIKS